MARVHHADLVASIVLLEVRHERSAASADMAVLESMPFFSLVFFVSVVLQGSLRLKAKDDGKQVAWGEIKDQMRESDVTLAFWYNFLNVEKNSALSFSHLFPLTDNLARMDPKKKTVGFVPDVCYMPLPTLPCSWNSDRELLIRNRQ